MSDSFLTYLRKLRETPQGEQTELTSRAALQALLESFTGPARHGIRVQHEPKRVAKRGAPDYKVHRPGQILGYVEVKEIGTNLDKELKSDQIAKYRKLSSNIILTDYLEFIWIDETRVRAREDWPIRMIWRAASFTLDQTRRRRFQSCWKASSPSPRRASASRSNWRWRWPRAASFCATFWCRS